MEDVTRKRIIRLLEELPEDRLYQVLDFIEFLDVKAAKESSRKPDAFQRFAERVEDQMRLRSVAPRAMKGTMRFMSTAGRVLDGVRELGQDVVGGLDRDTGSRERPKSGPEAEGKDGKEASGPS